LRRFFRHQRNVMQRNVPAPSIRGIKHDLFEDSLDKRFSHRPKKGSSQSDGVGGRHSSRHKSSNMYSR
jgi:hypothetical protein